MITLGASKRLLKFGKYWSSGCVRPIVLMPILVFILETYSLGNKAVHSNSEKFSIIIIIITIIIIIDFIYRGLKPYIYKYIHIYDTC